MSDFYIPSKHQAAGHEGYLISQGEGELFLKLTGPQEIEFYTETQDQVVDEDSLVGAALIDWMPLFMGELVEGNITRSVTEEGVIVPSADEQLLHDINEDAKDGKKYIVLENLYYGYSFPSILDIKLGSLLTDDTSGEEKVERLKKVSETTTSGSLNFRVCGMKVYNGKQRKIPEDIYPGMNRHVDLIEDNINGNYLIFSKFFGRSLSKETIKRGLLLWFTSYQSDKFIISNLISKFLKRLQLLYNCLLDSEVRIISGSLLFIYENDLKKWEPVLNNHEKYEIADPILKEVVIYDEQDENEDDDNDCSTLKTTLSRLNIIDFAHAKYVKGQGCDENIIVGVENIIQIFEEMHEELQ